MVTVDVSGSLLLIGIFFILIYMWWDSEKIANIGVFTMILVPYDFVVVINYLLPTYITDPSILSFTQIIFMILAVVFMAITLNMWNENRKNRSEKK
jgi:hypothetical protein